MISYVVKYPSPGDSVSSLVQGYGFSPALEIQTVVNFT